MIYEANIRFNINISFTNNKQNLYAIFTFVSHISTASFIDRIYQEITLVFSFVKDSVVGAALFFAGATAAWADDTGGCVDSPENPTVVLVLLGLFVASLPWLRQRFGARRLSGPRA